MAENSISSLSYAKDIDEYNLYILVFDQSTEAKITLETQFTREYEERKKECDRTNHIIAMLEYEKKQAEQQKQCLLDCKESGRSRLEQLRIQYLHVQEKRANMIEQFNANIKKYEEHWSTVNKRWEKIPHIKKYLEAKQKTETARANIIARKIESDKLRPQIALKKAELFEKNQKNIIEMANFMVNKRPLLLKLIHEKINENKKSTSAKHTYWNSTRNNKAYNTLMLPKLNLQDLDTISQVQNIDYNSAPNKRFTEALNSVKLVMLKKPKVTEKVDEEDFSAYFTSYRKIDETNREPKKYSDKKLINILKDVKLDAAGSYKIVSKLKLNQLQDVNVIKGRASQDDSKKDDPLQDTVIEKITEVVEEIDLTKKVSQDIVLPPTPFLDFTRSSQEKRVTFNDEVTIEDIPNLEADVDDVIPQAVNNTPNDQLNASTASDDSYKKLKDSVFKKYNVNLSPEFTYTKNKILPMVAEPKIVTSKFFDDNQAGNDINDSAKENTKEMEIIDDCGNPKQKINEGPTETIKQDDLTVENLFKGQEYKQKDVEPSCGPSFPYNQNMPHSPNISMSITGYEDAEFPQCIDSSFLLSPKAYDDAQARDDARNIDVLPQEGASFMSGLRKKNFSFLGNSSSTNKPEADGQNENNNFNFTFGGNEKKKRGGFFTMFQRNQ